MIRDFHRDVVKPTGIMFGFTTQLRQKRDGVPSPLRGGVGRGAIGVPCASLYSRNNSPSVTPPPLTPPSRGGKFWRAFFGTILISFLLSACAETPPAPKLALDSVGFGQLPGWSADPISEVVPALMRSCKLLAQKPPGTVDGFAYDWKPACAALESVPPQDDASARAFFEANFQPYAVHGPEGSEGLFTGYYESGLHGAWKRSKRYHVPLYARPRDLVTVDLGDFDAKWKGQHIEGQVTKGKLKPYDDRAAIEKHSLKHRARVLLWVDDPVDAFFLAIQGSGRVQMSDGKTVRVGYEIANGRSYMAIGRVMAAAGEIPPPVTMQKIRAWLSEHPESAQKEMNANPSYIFFHILKGNGPVGAEGVALTPARSMAVDPAFVPLGMPLWLDTQDGRGAPLRRLMVTQDTGGAIKGPVRGDFFWGFGPEAEEQAGAMQSQGTYYLLLPSLSANQ
jgi:membrane-bound lytic murein transglycosylase A